MGKITVVLFDLGNVLAYIDFNEFWRSLGFLHPEESAPFADGYKSWTHQYEIGCVSTSEYLAGLCSVFGGRFDENQLQEAFENIILEPVDGMMDIVTSVSCSHRTGLVSNTNEIHYKKSLKKFDVLPLLRVHYLSYQMHVMKPVREFYDMIINKEKVDPSTLLFIDDLRTNIDGALAIGMQAVRFENTVQLQEALKTLHVLL
jgi:putative hydrolase of the HAD superfamily